MVSQGTHSLEPAPGSHRDIRPVSGRGVGGNKASLKHNIYPNKQTLKDYFNYKNLGNFFLSFSNSFRSQRNKITPILENKLCFMTSPW